VDNKVTIGANSTLDTDYIITANSIVARDFLENDRAIHKHLRRHDNQGSKCILKTSKFTTEKKNTQKRPQKTFLTLNISDFN